jgi:branched-chain amino acid transport system ATP-binding protein
MERLSVPEPATEPAARRAPAEPLLAVDDITLRFGGVTALDGVSFEVRPGELFAVIGPNGAGPWRGSGWRARSRTSGSSRT